MSTKAPMQVVKEQHGGKDKLVAKILGLVEDKKGDLKDRLLRAPNRRLLRLWATLETVKSEQGLAQLAASVAEKEGRAKDKDYVQTLSAYTPGRLLARHKHARPPKAAKAGKAGKPAKGSRA